MSSLDTNYQTPISNFAIRSGVDLGIFHKLVEGNGNPVSLTELAETCKAEELMLSMAPVD